MKLCPSQDLIIFFQICFGLNYIYDFHPKLNVVFTGSSILELDHSKADLSRRVILYAMKGLSFREYLEIETGESINCLTLNEILTNHEQIAFDIVNKIKPLKYCLSLFTLGFFCFLFPICRDKLCLLCFRNENNQKRHYLPRLIGESAQNLSKKNGVLLWFCNFCVSKKSRNFV